MTATYPDVINAMIQAKKQGLTLDRVILTEESIDSFLNEEDLTDEEEQERKDVLGEEWKIAIEVGDRNVLVAEDRQFPL